jgi:hypothetical protein
MATNLSTALRTLSVLDPTLVTFLPEALGKLGRYYADTSKLICATRDRKCRGFLSVQIEPCEIRVPREILALNAPVSIDQAIEGLFESSDLPEDSKTLLKRAAY